MVRDPTAEKPAWPGDSNFERAKGAVNPAIIGKSESEQVAPAQVARAAKTLGWLVGKWLIGL